MTNNGSRDVYDVTTTAPPPAQRSTQPSYLHLARRPGGWWRPLVSTALLPALTIALVILIMLGSVIYEALHPDQMAIIDDAMMSLDEDAITPAGTLIMNLMIALGIPISIITLRLAFGRPAGRIHSVVGRLRWNLIARLTTVALPLYIVYVVFIAATQGGLRWDPIPGFGAMLVVILLTTPLQSAGEEYLTRGWLLQTFGAWFRNEYVALGVTMVLSSVVFTALHGSSDPGVIAVLVATSVATVLLTWRTGGLEAAIVLHACNNVALMVLGSINGMFAEGVIDENTTASLSLVAVEVAALSVVTLVMWKLYERYEQSSDQLSQSSSGDAISVSA